MHQNSVELHLIVIIFFSPLGGLYPSGHQTGQPAFRRAGTYQVVGFWAVHGAEKVSPDGVLPGLVTGSAL